MYCYCKDPVCNMLSVDMLSGHLPCITIAVQGGMYSWDQGFLNTLFHVIIINMWLLFAIDGDCVGKRQYGGLPKRCVYLRNTASDGEVLLLQWINIDEVSQHTNYLYWYYYYKTFWEGWTCKLYSQSSCKRPPQELKKVVVTWAGRLREWALVIDHMLKQ